MPYRNFTFRDLTENWGLQLQGVRMFEEATPVQSSIWLTETLRKSRKLGFINEKERSERIISPFLAELNEINENSFTIYSGRNLDVDETLGLTGECDFIFSFSRVLEVVQAPIFAITEAKKEDIDGGTVQCAMQLLAADLLNKKQGAERKNLYGCTTTGEVWRFMKLQNKTLYLDEDRYYITSPDVLLGVLNQVIHFCKQDI